MKTKTIKSERNGSPVTPEPTKQEVVQIKPLRERTIEVKVKGAVPYKQLRFSAKKRDQIRATQEAGSQSNSKKKRNPKDFKAEYEDAMYRFEDGSYGIPAASFRNAMISACRLVGFKMTIAKLSFRCIQDGYDIIDKTMLVRITKGEPSMCVDPCRNANGSIDLRVRAEWQEGWEAIVRIWFDEDQFSASDIVTLLQRAGLQVGIGEGRPDGRDGNGMGLGLFTVVMEE